MQRITRIVAVLLVSGVLGACGTEQAPSSPPADPGGTATPSGAAPPPSTPSPSLNPQPRTTFPQTMAAWVRATYQGDHRYVGDCREARPGPGAVCAKREATVDGGVVHGVGAPSSEIDAYVYAREGGSGWRIVDEFTPSSDMYGPATEPTPAWFEALGRGY
ncbi:hypothetical protein [Micromonospora halophytica]|uniref:Lipoprotein n=1 Tax=Micromonospora halophytica TaxID=47864 RepID=A0A1C5IDB5_9ACTN|nr:hypothetical protein [Micromonospora halophytica]SCG56264.1 hypothetical protein GA0070560_11080 [Micromonospora halophytica]